MAMEYDVHPDLGKVPCRWEIKAIGDVADVTKLAGYEFTKHITYLDDGEIIALRSLNVVDGQLDLSSVKRISKLASDELPRSKLFVNDILLTYTGSKLGGTALIDANDKYHLAPNVCRLRALDPDDSYFIYVFLRSGVFANLLNIFKVGTGQPTVPMKNIRKIPIPWPSQKERRDIGQSFSYLTNKIELNRQINTTLESMAQALFKSWFVDFDPVIDNALAAGNPIPDELSARAERRKSLRENLANPHLPLPADIQQLFPNSFVFTEEMGWVPEGWGIVAMSDLCESVQNGSTPKRMEEAYWIGGTINWFKTGELGDSVLLASEEKITEEGLKKSSCKLWEKGTVLIAIYAAPTVGRLGILTESAASNQACSALIPKPEVGPYYIYSCLREARDWLNTVAVGAAQQNISKAVVESVPALKVNTELLEQFNLIQKAFWKEIELLSRQIETLVSLRDKLLPKLLSGQLQIPEAEQQLAEVI